MAGKRLPNQIQPNDVTFLPDVPINIDQRLRGFLSAVKKRVERTLANPDPPDPVDNFLVTPLTFGNLLTWNPVQRTTSYTIYLAIGSIKFTDAVAIGTVPKARATSFFDSSAYHLKSGVTLTYWVVGRNIQLDGPLSESVSIVTGTQPITLQDTWANRGNYIATDYPSGTIIRYYDVDLLYMQRGGNWEYAAGVWRDIFANRPGGLAVRDTGLRFVATDTAQHFVWGGAAFVEEYEIHDAGTNSTLALLNLIHRSSGTPAAGFGAALDTYLDSAANTSRPASELSTTWIAATDGAETAGWAVRLRAAGAALADYFKVLTTGIKFNVGGFFGIFVHANTADRTYTFPDKDTIFDWGTYTPTAAGVANISASTPHTFNWMRVGNTISVSGSVDITPTINGTTLTELTLTLPVTSSSVDSIGGSAVGSATGAHGVEPFVVATTSNKALLACANVIDTNADTYYVHFQYHIT